MSGKCDKIPFDNKAAAEESIGGFEPGENKSYVPVRSYLCEKCGQWHMTSKESHKKRMKPTRKRRHKQDLTKWGQVMFEVEERFKKTLKRKKNKKKN